MLVGADSVVKTEFKVISKMKINEIEMVGDNEFPYSLAEQHRIASNPMGMFDRNFMLNYLEEGHDRVLILTDDDRKIAAYAGFRSRINGKVWQSKNIATYDPYKGQQLAGKLYKYVKEKLNKSLQSDLEQTWAGRKLWTKTLPALGLQPMIFDTKTERIADPRVTDINVYPDDSSPDLHRYCWILERRDHYPEQNLVNESSLLMPFTGMWYNPK